MNIENELRETLKPIAEEQGLDITDVAYIDKDDGYYIRVYIYKEDITDADCIAFREATKDIMNEIKPIDAFIYEVCINKEKRSGTKDLHTEIISKVVSDNKSQGYENKHFYLFEDGTKLLSKPLNHEEEREKVDKHGTIISILPSKIFI